MKTLTQAQVQTLLAAKEQLKKTAQLTLLQLENHSYPQSDLCDEYSEEIEHLDHDIESLTLELKAT